MKKIFISFLLIPFYALAQTATLKDIPADQDGTTTISISKGDKKAAGEEYQITDGVATISGEPEILDKAARASWKAACADWKKELKELNVGNQVLAMNCSKPSCERTGSTETVCSSKAEYKLKIKIK